MNYLQYVNIVLQAVNEVPLTATQFSSARGLHLFAKDAVMRAYLDIIQEYKWPWMQDGTDVSLGTIESSGERSLIPIDQWTTIPVTDPYKDAIDWSSIYYKNSLGEKYPLTVLDWEFFEDAQEYVERRTRPQYIVQSADGKSMGLFALPTEDLGKIYYRIWTRPSLFTFDTDVIPMPEMHYNILVDGALHHMWSFRGNVEQAQMAYTRFKDGIKKMKLKYSTQTLRLRWA